MRRYGLIGRNITKSFSPVIHNGFFEEYEVDAQYKIYDLPNLKHLKELVQDEKLEGFNVTIPYKQEIIPLINTLSPDSTHIKAVNTVIVDNDKFQGYNTDADGFIMSLKLENSDVAGKNILINASGGSARAIGYAVLKNKCKNLVITGRNNKTRMELCDDLIDIFDSHNVMTFAEIHGMITDIAINATPMGAFDNDELSMDLNVMSAKEVYDITYGRKKSKLLQLAKELDIKAYDGIGMLVCQAAISQKLWTNNNIELDSIKKMISKIRTLY